MLESKFHGAALYTFFGTPRSIRIRSTFACAVVHRIGVNDHAGRAILLAQEGLHATEIFSVTNQHNLAPDIHSALLQELEIFRPTVIRIHDVGGDVARR